MFYYFFGIFSLIRKIHVRFNKVEVKGKQLKSTVVNNASNFLFLMYISIIIEHKI